MRYKLWLVIIGILLLVSKEVVFALSSSSIVTEAESITYSSDKNALLATGKARVTLTKLTVSAEVIYVDIKANKLIAADDVLIENNNGDTFKCNSLSLDIGSLKGFIYNKDSTPAKATFNAGTFKVEGEVKEFPPDAFQVNNVIDSRLCITGKKAVIHPRETAQIKPAIIWLNGNKTLSLPFYSASLGSRITQPRVSYSNYGATVDVPVIFSLGKNSISIAHLKKSPQVGASLTIEHQLKIGERSEVNFYIDDINKNKYRRARLIYRQNLGRNTNFNLNLDWQNDKTLNIYFNAYQMIKRSTFNINMRAQRGVAGRPGRPLAMDITWQDTPRQLFGSPITFALTGGLSLTGNNYQGNSVWSRKLGLRLTHRPIKLGKNSSLLMSLNNEFSWLTNGESGFNLNASANFRFGQRTSMDIYFMKNNYSMNNGSFREAMSGSIGFNTRFTDNFSTRITYNFNQSNNFYPRIGNSSYYYQDISTYFTYNKSGKMEISIGTRYDLKESRFRTAEGNFRFKFYNLFYLTLRPQYDFVSQNRYFNFDISPAYGQ